MQGLGYTCRVTVSAQHLSFSTLTQYSRAALARAEDTQDSRHEALRPHVFRLGVAAPKIRLVVLGAGLHSTAGQQSNRLIALLGQTNLGLAWGEPAVCGIE
jgi:hypothetical protein